MHAKVLASLQLCGKEMSLTSQDSKFPLFNWQLSKGFNKKSCPTIGIRRIPLEHHEKRTAKNLGGHPKANSLPHLHP